MAHLYQVGDVIRDFNNPDLQGSVTNVRWDSGRQTWVYQYAVGDARYEVDEMWTVLVTPFVPPEVAPPADQDSDPDNPLFEVDTLAYLYYGPQVAILARQWIEPVWVYDVSDASGTIVQVPESYLSAEPVEIPDGGEGEVYVPPPPPSTSWSILPWLAVGAGALLLMRKHR